ncbi:MAG: carboxylating nicotinate-nucleotide diphosphorylase [Gammaproteobacteria bacterium]
MPNMTKNGGALQKVITLDARAALREDVGDGDMSAALAGDIVSCGVLFCRQRAVLCGAPWFEKVFLLLDSGAIFDWRTKEGEMTKGEVCTVTASAKALLSGERAAVNFLQTLSATATAARKWQKRAQQKQPGLMITDTRKTIPKLRAAQKYAVRIGGAHNHRMGLFDEILIKENHIRAAGSIAEALRKAKKECADSQKITTEVRDGKELQQALQAGAKRILLDNFSVNQLRAAVKINRGRAQLEASGGISYAALPEIAASGVNRISAGALTKNIRAVDFSFIIK